MLKQKLRYYKYIVKSLKINGAGEPIDVEPFQVTDIYIERDFEHDYFPIFRITVRLDPQTLFKVLKKKDAVTFHLRLQKKAMDQNKLKSYPAEDLINRKFSIYHGDHDPFYGEKEYKQVHKATKKNPRDFGIPMDFYLFPEEELNATKKIVNKCFVTINMTDAVTYVLNQASIGKMLMAPLDNGAEYKQMLLPALSALESIEFLQEVYGFYEDGGMIFFDLDRNYIIPYNDKCLAWTGGEIKETIIMSKARNNETIMHTGSLLYNNTYIVNAIPDNIAVRSESVSEDQTRGKKIMAIDSRNDDIRNKTAMTKNRGPGSVKIIADKYGNKYTDLAIKRQREATSMLVNVTLFNYDYDIFKPNKKIKMVFEEGSPNSHAGGTYQIAKTIAVFRKTMGTEFEMTTQLILKK